MPRPNKNKLPLLVSLLGAALPKSYTHGCFVQPATSPLRETRLRSGRTCIASALPFSHRRTALSAGPPEQRNDDETCWEQLLDDCVDLYSRIDTSSSSIPSEAEIRQEIVQLRQAEVSTLIRDLTLAQFEPPKSENSPPPLSLNELTVTQLSTLLDHAILDQYDVTHTDDQQDKWVSQINRIVGELDDRQRNGPLLTSLAKATEPAFAVRLEQLTTVIDPVPQLPLPLVGSSTSATNGVADTIPKEVLVTTTLGNDGNSDQAGAVAVTKAPVFAAGIALGPAVKSTLAFVKKQRNGAFDRSGKNYNKETR